MTEKKEKTPLEQTGAARIPLVWSDNLPAGSIGIYNSEQHLFLVRADMDDPQIQLAIATCLAAYDIATNGPNPEHGTDAQALAISRLLPDERFTEAYAALDGGVTRLARFFGVTPMIIRTKLDMMGSDGRAARGRADCDPTSE